MKYRSLLRAQTIFITTITISCFTYCFTAHADFASVETVTTADSAGHYTHPRLAIDGSGVLVGAWSHQLTGNFPSAADIEVASSNSSAWTETTVDSIASDNTLSLFPTSVAISSGNGVATWEYETNPLSGNDTQELRTSLFDSGWSAHQTIGSAFYPSYAAFALPAASVAIAYMDSSADDAVKVRETSGAFGSPITLTDVSESPEETLKASSSPDGDAAVAWGTFGSDHCDVRVAKRSSTGVWQTGTTVPNSSGTNCPSISQPAVVDGGAAAVVWVDNETRGQISLGLQNGNGGWTTEPVYTIPNNRSVNTDSLFVGLQSSGEVTVTWTQSITGGTALEVRRRSSAGVWGPLHEFTGAGGDNSLAMSQSGKGVIAFNFFNGTKYEMHALMIAADGTLSGPTTISATEDDQPSAAIRESGDGAILWTGEKDSSTDAVYAVRFSSSLQDNCPNDPDKTDPGICGCGVADVDRNNNGVMDCLVEKDFKTELSALKNSLKVLKVATSKTAKAALTVNKAKTKADLSSVKAIGKTSKSKLKVKGSVPLSALIAKIDSAVTKVLKINKSSLTQDKKTASTAIDNLTRALK